MGNKFLVKLSNLIGIISIILLIYWVFTYILIQVFGLRVFRENITETFYLSVLGILSLMVGALIINIMFNLTRIAQKHNADFNHKSVSKTLIWGLLSFFPIITFLLFGGDYLTSIKKEKLLIKSAKSVVENNKFLSNKLLNYSFNKKYVTETAKTLEIFSLTDKNFPNVSVILKDTIDQSPVFLSFDDNYTIIEEENYIFRKTNYIKRTNQSEREYLNMVFDQKKPDTRYSSHSGEYELFYPYIKGNKIIVLYFYDHQRYGKIGS